MVVDLAANVAQLKTDMESAKGVVETTGAAITGVANVAKTALGALGVAFSVNEVKAWAEDVISSTAALNDFAQKTGSSVETLSRLANQAAVSGKDFASLEQLTTRLAVNMRDFGDTGKAAGAALDYLGVTARDPADALLEVAQAMEQYADGAGKAALAKDLFGKNGPQFIDFLHDLAQAHSVGATRTAEQARAADELEESWRRLKVEGTYFSDMVLNNLVPALQREVDAMRVARDVDLPWLDWGKGLPYFIDQITLLGVQVDNVKRQIEKTPSWNLFASDALTAQLTRAQADMDKAAQARDAFINLWVQRLGYVGDAHDQMARNSAASVSKIVSDYKGASEATKEVKEQTEDFAKAIDALQLELDKLTGAGEGGSDYEKALLAVNRALLEGKVITNDAIDRYLNLARAVTEAKKAHEEADAVLKIAIEDAKAEQKALDDWNKAILAALASYTSFYARMQDVIDASNAEVATFGLSAEALRDLNAQRKIEAELRETLNGLQGEALQGARDEAVAQAERAKQTVLANNAMLDSLRSWRDLLTDVTSATADFLVDFVNNGSDAFKRLWQRFRDWALEALAEIAAKQIVVSIVGALGLGGAGGALAAGGITEGGAASTLLSALGLAGNSGGGIGGSLLSALGLGGGGEWAAGSTGLLELVGGGGLGGLAGFLPYAGIAALALPLLGGLFGSKGGPMDRQYGLSGGGLGDFGDFSGLHKLIGTDAAQSSGYNAMAAGLSADYLRYVTLLGGTPGAAAFSVYSSMDPKGTAPSNVDVRAALGGTEVYRGDNFGVGRSQAEVDAALRDQAAQAILAALKASNVSDLVKAFLGEVQVTADTIDAVVQAAAVMQKLPADLQAAFVDAIKINPEALEQLAAFNAAFVDLSTTLDTGDKLVTDFATGVLGLADATDTAYGKAGMLLEELVGLTDAYDGSASQTAALAKGTDAYVQALGAALQEIAQIRTGLATMFGDSIENIRLAVLTEQQRADFLKREALENIRLLKEATDPRQIDKLSKTINEDLMKVFNMLSPEEQRRQQQWFIDRLTEAGNLADAQLIASGNALLGEQEDGRTILATIRDQLTAAARIQYEAAVALGKAAGTFSGSVEDFDAIAKKPVQVSVTVTQKKTTTPEPAPYNPGYSTGLEPYDPNQMYSLGDPRLGVVTP